LKKVGRCSSAGILTGKLIHFDALEMKTPSLHPSFGSLAVAILIRLETADCDFGIGLTVVGRI
jgi:hypothetical protein